METENFVNKKIWKINTQAADNIAATLSNNIAKILLLFS